MRDIAHLCQKTHMIICRSILKRMENMKKLIIDGNSVFEIDEECVKRRKVPKSCDIEKYLKNDGMDFEKRTHKTNFPMK